MQEITREMINRVSWKVASTDYKSVSIVKTWQAHGMFFEVTELSLYGFGVYHCGYATFTGISPDASYETFEDVDVHYGVTYVKAYPKCVKVGFDCAHLGDDTRSYTKDIHWLTQECEKMGKQAQKIVNG